MPRGVRWPWFAAAGVACLSVAVLVLSILAGDNGNGWPEIVLGGLTIAVSTALGLLIAVRRPGNPMGWILLANGAVFALAGVAEAYAQYAVLESPGALPGGAWAVLWYEQGWPVDFAPLVAIALLFPDGRLPSPRWRPIAIGMIVTLVAAQALTLFEGAQFGAPFEAVENPVPAVPGIEWLWLPVMLGGVASLIAAASAVRMRFRRAVGIERLQLKWLAYSSALIPALFVICLAFALAGQSADETDAFGLLFFTTLIAVPGSVGVAVLQYRLYDIDRVINRTLVYGVLTLLLAGIYAGGALLFGAVVGSGSSWATAAATLLAALAFRPLRAAVQDVVDRRFSRARYDGLRRVGAFLEDLRAGRAAPEAIEPVLTEVLDDPALELRFWLPESAVYVDGRGRAVVDQPGDGRLRTPVTRAGVPLGLVLHGPIDDERPGLLGEVVETAGLAIEIVRLRVELRRQLEHVQASRARIVATGYAERRRLERDLHDGAQQRLVSIGLALRHAQHELGPGSNGARELLDDAVDEVGHAINELRELARGVRPAQLDAGLAPALRELAARAPLPVQVQAGGGRYPEALEATAYFIASEGLTNAVKHACATRVTLRAERFDGALIVSVVDDGVGGAAPSRGSGLRGLADRAEAHGGTIRLDTVEDGGTALIAELPCGS